MIAGLDSSSSKPTLTQARSAYDSGVRVWGLYPAGFPGASSTWTDAQIDVLRAAGLQPLAFFFQPADPHQARAWGLARRIPICLDIESPWPNGPWSDAWLAASGAGVYGGDDVMFGAPAHALHAHPFHIYAAYPSNGDPGRTWPVGRPRPAVCAWQWRGTHMEFGVSVDRAWYDDVFMAAQPSGVELFPGGPRMSLFPNEDDAILFCCMVVDKLFTGANVGSPQDETNQVALWKAQGGAAYVTAIMDSPVGLKWDAALATLRENGITPPTTGTGGGLSQSQVQQAVVAAVKEALTQAAAAVTPTP